MQRAISSKTIDLSAQASGIYFARVSGEGFGEVMRLVRKESRQWREVNGESPYQKDTLLTDHSSPLTHDHLDNVQPGCV